MLLAQKEQAPHLQNLQDTVFFFSLQKLEHLRMSESPGMLDMQAMLEMPVRLIRLKTLFS